MTEEDIIKCIRNYFDVDDRKDFDVAIKQCDKEELKRKNVNQSLHIKCDEIENVINFLINLKKQGYTNISDFEVYKYGKEDVNEYERRIYKIITDEIEHIREKRRGTINKYR